MISESELIKGYRPVQSPNDLRINDFNATAEARIIVNLAESARGGKSMVTELLEEAEKIATNNAASGDYLAYVKLEALRVEAERYYQWYQDSSILDKQSQYRRDEQDDEN